MSVQEAVAAYNGTGRHLTWEDYATYAKGDEQKKKHALLFQKMYEQHGTPALITRFIGLLISFALVILVVGGFERQLAKYERTAELAGVIKIEKEEVEMRALI